jgi:hypothetical protein
MKKCNILCERAAFAAFGYVCCKQHTIRHFSPHIFSAKPRIPFTPPPPIIPLSHPPPLPASFILTCSLALTIVQRWPLSALSCCAVASRLGCAHVSGAGDASGRSGCGCGIRSRQRASCKVFRWHSLQSRVDDWAGRGSTRNVMTRR